MIGAHANARSFDTSCSDVIRFLWIQYIKEGFLMATRKWTANHATFGGSTYLYYLILFQCNNRRKKKWWNIREREGKELVENAYFAYRSRRVTVQGEKSVLHPTERKSLFRARCNKHKNCCVAVTKNRCFCLKNWLRKMDRVTPRVEWLLTNRIRKFCNQNSTERR